MKKEVIIAIIIGFSLGLVITFGIHTARRNRNGNAQDTFTNPLPSDGNPQVQSQNDIPLNHQIELASPLPNSVVDENPVQMVGTTTPLSLVAILNGTISTSTAADATGHFSAQLDLTPGINNVSLISYSPTFEAASISAILVYTPIGLNSATSTNSGTTQ